MSEEIEKDASGQIPSGYQRITEGVIQENDLVWNRRTKEFQPVLAEILPFPNVGNYYFLIRKI